MGSMPRGADGARHTVRTPKWPGAIVHARGGRPVLIEREPIGPEDPVDLRCHGCKADAEVRFDVLDPERSGMIAYIAHHKPGCWALAERLKLAGRARP